LDSVILAAASAANGKFMQRFRCELTSSPW
jgi:hypothetical protein